MKFRNTFYCFIAASSLGTLSTTCIRFSIAWYAMQKTGSAVVFAAMIAASGFAEVYSKPLTSPLADYFDRLGIFRICTASPALVAAALLGSVWLMDFSAVWITILLIGLSLVAGLRDPTAAGLVPSLVDAEHMTQAQSLRSSVSSTIGLGGSMLAGLIVAAAGVESGLTVAAVLAILGVVCAVFVVPTSERLPPKDFTVYLRTWHHRTVDGMRAVWLTKAERETAFAAALINMAVVPFSGFILPVWVSKDLGSSPALMAYIEGGLAVGVIIGSAFVTTWSNAWLGRFQAMVAGTALMGAGFIVASLLTNPVGIVMCMVFCGIGFMTFAINVSTLRGAATPPAFRSRLFGGVGFLSCCLYPLTSQAFGFVVEHAGAAHAVLVCGGLVLCAACVQFFNRDAKVLLGQPDEAIMGAYGTLYPNAFKERIRVRVEHV